MAIPPRTGQPHDSPGQRPGKTFNITSKAPTGRHKFTSKQGNMVTWRWITRFVPPFQDSNITLFCLPGALPRADILLALWAANINGTPKTPNAIPPRMGQPHESLGQRTRKQTPTHPKPQRGGTNSRYTDERNHKPPFVPPFQGSTIARDFKPRALPWADMLMALWAAIALLAGPKDQP